MGCCCDDSNKYFLAYKNIKSVHNLIENDTFNSQSSLFLVSTKSIRNFIEIMKNSKVLSPSDESELSEYEKNLKKSFIKYEQETIRIYSDYKNCLSIIDKKEMNEFIIVNEDFMKNMRHPKEEKKEVKLIVKNRNAHILEVEFSSNEKLEIKNKETIFYEFIKKNENNNILEQNDDNNNHNEEEIQLNNNYTITIAKKKNNYQCGNPNQIEKLGITNNENNPNSNIDIIGNITNDNKNPQINMTSINNKDKDIIIKDREKVNEKEKEPPQLATDNNNNNENNNLSENKINNIIKKPAINNIHDSTRPKDINVTKSKNNEVKESKIPDNPERGIVEDSNSHINPENNKNNKEQNIMDDYNDGAFYEATDSQISDENNKNNKNENNDILILKNNKNNNIENNEGVYDINGKDKKESISNKNDKNNDSKNNNYSNISEGAFYEDSQINSKNQIIENNNQDANIKQSLGAFFEDSNCDFEI